MTNIDDTMSNIRSQMAKAFCLSPEMLQETPVGFLPAYMSYQPWVAEKILKDGQGWGQDLIDGMMIKYMEKVFGKPKWPKQLQHWAKKAGLKFDVEKHRSAEARKLNGKTQNWVSRKGEHVSIVFNGFDFYLQVASAGCVVGFGATGREVGIIFVLPKKLTEEIFLFKLKEAFELYSTSAKRNFRSGYLPQLKMMDTGEWLKAANEFDSIRDTKQFYEEYFNDWSDRSVRGDPTQQWKHGKRNRHD